MHVEPLAGEELCCWDGRLVKGIVNRFEIIQNKREVGRRRVGGRMGGDVP